MLDWDAIACSVLDILRLANRDRRRMHKEARNRGVSLEQLQAAAITEMIREELEKSTPKQD
jgi:hypothetical protein